MRRVLLVLLASVLAACSLAPLPGDWKARHYRLYYGHDRARLDALVAGAPSQTLTILDSRKLAASDLQRWHHDLRRHQSALILYLSIGELEGREVDAFARFASAHCQDVPREIKKIGFEWNEKFQSWRVDVSQPCWRRWVFTQADRLNAQGDGLFLDTPDTADRYVTHPGWSRTERGEKIRAMVSLVRELKARAPGQYILLNRGLNLVSAGVWMDEDGKDLEPGLALMTPHPHNPDAVLYENAFVASDPWTQRIEADLRATAKAGRTQVLVLGYADTFGDRARFGQRAAAEGQVAAWAESSTTLHISGTEDAN